MNQVTITDNFNRTGELDGSHPTVTGGLDTIEAMIDIFGDSSEGFEAIGLSDSLGAWVADDSMVTDGSKVSTYGLTAGSAFLPWVQLFFIDPDVFSRIQQALISAGPGADPQEVFLDIFLEGSDFVEIGGSDFWLSCSHSLDSLDVDQVSHSFGVSGLPIGYIKGSYRMDVSSITSLSDISGFAHTEGIFACYSYFANRYNRIHSGNPTLLDEITFLSAIYISDSNTAPAWISSNLVGPYPLGDSGLQEESTLAAFFDPDDHYVWYSESTYECRHSSWNPSFGYFYNKDLDVLTIQPPGTDSSPDLTESEIFGGLGSYIDGGGGWSLDFSSLNIPDTANANFYSSGYIGASIYSGIFLGGSGVWSNLVNSRVRLDDYRLSFGAPVGSSGWYVGVPAGGLGSPLSYLETYLLLISLVPSIPK